MSVFRAYDVRGLVPKEINEDFAKLLGLAIPNEFTADKILVGHDMRTHSKKIVESLIQGLIERGIDVYDMGQCSSAQFYFTGAYYKFDQGVMVTASHNPKEYNGFKFIRKNATPVSYESGLNKLEKLHGKIHKISKNSGIIHQIDSKEDFDLFLEKNIDAPNKLKIVINAANGMGGVDAKIISKYHKVKGVYYKPDGNFPNYTPNPLLEKFRDDIYGQVKIAKADIGIGLDGDDDRAGFFDENGQYIPSDYILALMIDRYCKPGDTVIADLRISRVAEEVAKKKDIKVVRSRVGHSYMAALMRKHDACIGAELSGHYYFKDSYYRDMGVMAAILVTNILSRNEGTISQLVEPYKKYVLSEEINFEVKDKEQLFDKLKESFKKEEKEYLDGITIKGEKFWFNVRASNTEPVIRFRGEARDEAILEQVIEQVQGLIKT